MDLIASASGLEGYLKAIGYFIAGGFSGVGIALLIIFNIDTPEEKVGHHCEIW